MSHTARDLLVRGTAAAIANSPDEARFYLEWVLITDASPEQKADAHYWLSRVANDPAEKCAHLESVLASNPHYPEARRDLALLEGRINPRDLVDHRHGVPPITLHASVAPGNSGPQKCPQCGAKLSARLLDGAPLCRFCGYQQGNERQSTIQEQDWIAAIHTARGHSWTLPTERIMQCQGCGAQTSITPSHTSVECPFCGGAYVIREADANLVEPEAIAPFAFDAEIALQHARDWLDEQSFRPNDLEELAASSRPRPIYLPFWTFDLDGEVRWIRSISERSFGPDAALREEIGSKLLSYDDILVPATRSLSPDLLTELRFDTSSILPYSPQMLADWPAELYSISVADASLDALHSVYKDTRAIIDTDPTGEGLKIERPQVSISSYKLVLLPLWFTHYAYRGRSFDIAINGTTGEAHGDLPRNTLQRFLGGLLGE